MKYRFRIFPLFVIILMTITACQIGTASLSSEQLQEFVREKQIQPLAVADVNGDATAVLYKDNKIVGCYVVWAGNGIDNRLKLTNAITSANDIFTEPVTALYHSTFGNDIVCLTINQKDLQNKAYSVK